MEENVALDSSKQKQFVKSIKGIKKLIKKNDKDGVAGKIHKSKGKGVKAPQQKRQPRGLVYLGHIPHGFYENEMTQYFKQFGVVTKVRVIRSKRTGRSKGHAFVEFKDPDVAEVVADTMNNYLMGKRLIKAASIPPEKQRRFAPKKNWNAIHNPTNEMRVKMRKAYNASKDEDGEIKMARQILSTFRKTKKKLNNLGINYDIFTPVDVPELLSELLSQPEVKQETSKTKIDDKIESKKNIKKEQKVPEKTNRKQEKINKKDEKADKKDGKINKKNDKILKKDETTNKKGEVISQKKELTKTEKVAVKNEQKLKEEKLKVAGVKSVDNFIKINNQDTDNSDSDYEFDSDEFNKMLTENDSELDSADENDAVNESEENDSELEESEDEVPAPKTEMTKNKTNVKATQQVIKKQSPQKNKRKAVEKPITTTKKSKFENRNTQKLSKKQFKKRK